MWIKFLFVTISLFVQNQFPNIPIEENQPPIVNPEPKSEVSPVGPTEDKPQNTTSNVTKPINVSSIETQQKEELAENPTPTTNETIIRDPINLHLMVASHTDAGWIYTFEQYYQGQTKKDGGCVKCILNNVMASLPLNSSRKYDMSEVSFFNRWWSDQDEEKREAFRKLVKNNQFGFMNGAWVANDEAAAYYEDIMDNFILGHRWLKEKFDLDPLVGWQVDSFGNSAAHAALMAQAGYEGLFFSRADYVDRDLRIKEQRLQFNWAPPNPHNESVFTQMTYVGYADATYVIPQNSYCRTLFCMGNLKPNEFQKVTNFVRKQSLAFKTRNVLLLVCDDFLFTDKSELYYVGAEDLINYYDSHPELGIKAKYSHLTDYLTQVSEDLLALKPSANLSVKHDDFYPYIERQGHVWTGYFTSKPMYKLLVREYSEYYNAAKLLLAKVLLSGGQEESDQELQKNISQALNSMEEPMAIAQHHDSITGTMKEFVRYDYENMLSEGRRKLEEALQPIMLNYLKDQLKESLLPSPARYDWFYLDDNYDHVFDPDYTTTFIVFNPGSARKLLVKVKVPTPNYGIIDESNEKVETDTICHSQDANSDCYIYFAEDFDAYSTRIYKIYKLSENNQLASDPIGSEGAEVVIANQVFLRIYGDLMNFYYEYCQEENSCVQDTFNLNYEYYESMPQRNKKAFSGAYLFSPNPETKFNYSTILSGRVYKGKYFTLIQIFRDNMRTDLKIVSHEPERGIEIASYLEPVTNFPRGKQIVLIVRSSIVENALENGDTIFYTDANGYYMQKRQKGHKDDYPVSAGEGVSMNYYPMTSNIYIEDADSGKRMSVVTDRPQGATSLLPKEIEVMIHRVTNTDDSKGVAEPLKEKNPEGNGTELIRVKTRHFLSFSHPNSGIPDQRRKQQYDLDRPLQLWFYSSDNKNFVEVVAKEDQNQLKLPNLVKFYVRSYQFNEYIVRFHNLDEINGKKKKIYDIKSKKCSLLNQFTGTSAWKVISITELSWMTTREKSEVKKNVLDPNEPTVIYEDGADYSSISLLPMEIRTFSIIVSDGKNRADVE